MNRGRAGTIGRYLLPAAVIVLAAIASGCSVTGSSSASTNEVTPSVVGRWVLIQEAEANLTRVINVMSSTDLTDQLLAQSTPRTQRHRNLVIGSQNGWNSVLTTLNAFTPAQGQAAPQVVTTVGETKLVATKWLNMLYALTQHPARDRRSLLKMLKLPLRLQYRQRHVLNDLARVLAKESCTLGSTYSQLAAPKDVVAACGAAKTLAAPPPSS